MDDMLRQTLSELETAGRPLILDGGLGSELAARGCDIDTGLWSAEPIISSPDSLLEAHRAYLEAGADCITSASYQASVPALRQRGLDEPGIRAVFEESTRLACRARDTYVADRPRARRPLVAASIGPYGAYLADGSEYRGNYGLSDNELREFHAARLQWLDDSGADLLAVETIPDLQEARVLAQLLQTVRTPAWISFCCRDAKHLHDGNALRDAAGLFSEHPRVFAVGVNCCPGDIVEESIGVLRAAAADKFVVVYPNSGEQYDAATRDWDDAASIDNWSDMARRWFDAGAGLIGGCCRIGPKFIRKLANLSTWRC